MNKLEPYIIFNGNCEEAFNFYGKVFEGEFTAFLRYKDVPGEIKFTDEEMERILHVCLPINPYVNLMGCDSPGKLASIPGDNVALSVTFEVEREAISVFAELSEGGAVHMKLQQTFWANLYGVVTDRFGIRWMIGHVVNEETDD